VSYSPCATRAGLTAAVFLLVLSGCSRAPRPAVERVALVAFDNLSANADLSWVGRAIAAVAAAQTAGDERIQTFSVATLRDAESRRATRTVEGYLTEHNGAIRLRSSLRDEISGRIDATASATGDIFTLAAEVARGTGANIRPYTTSNVGALENYVRGLAETDAGATEARLREAIRLDPGYGAPYVALHELLTRLGRTDEARTLLAGASGLRLTKSEEARVRAASAATPRERLDAVIELARLQPGDIDTWRRAAEAAVNMRLYDKALAAVEEVLRLSPADEGSLNLRGYIHVYRGDFEAARAAFEEYRKRAPESANAIDSAAEMMFYFRRYNEAAKLFLDAHAKLPALMNGAEPLRAAFAYYLAGNLAEADRVFATWVPAQQDVRTSIWRRWTGRASNDAPAAVRALWTLRDGDRKAAAELAATARREAGNPAAVNLSSVALLLSQPSAPPETWRTRVSQALPAPPQQALRDQLLGWALLLDGHARAAADHWTAVLQRTSPQFDNEARILLAASLLQAGETERARRAMPHGFLPPPGMPLSLDLLLYPIAVDTSAKLTARR
jgi:tetratricopeptide (TPR) repeat protein